MRQNILTKAYKFILRALTFKDYQNLGWATGYGVVNHSGEQVTISNGTRISTAFSCVNALSQDVAKLPFNVLQTTDKGREVVKGPIQNLIHLRPNMYTNAFNFWQHIIWDMLTDGNGYAVIKKDAQQNPIGLYIINPHECEPVLIDNEVFYSFNDVVISSRDMLHFKLYSFDGIKGVSPIIYNSQAFGLRLKQERYKAQVLGTRPTGILTFDQQLDAEQNKQNRESWQKMTQGNNLGQTPVLSGSAKYTPFMFNANDSQMIESAKMSNTDITGIYRVPPTIIQDYERATFSNAEQQNLVYLKYSITPILCVIEQECNIKLFKESNMLSDSPMYTKFNIKGMLRGDIATQTEFYKFLRSHGLASANTILEMEDLPKLEGDQGDIVVVQGAFVPLDQLRDFYDNKENVDKAKIIENE